MGPTDGIWRRDALVDGQRGFVVRAGGVMVGAGEGDVAQASDAVGLTEERSRRAGRVAMPFHSERGRRHGRERSKGDVAQALDAVGLAEEGADALVERPGRRSACGRCHGRSVRRAMSPRPDAVGLAEEGADALVERPGRS